MSVFGICLQYVLSIFRDFFAFHKVVSRTVAYSPFRRNSKWEVQPTRGLSVGYVALPIYVETANTAELENYALNLTRPHEIIDLDGPVYPILKTRLSEVEFC